MKQTCKQCLACFKGRSDKKFCSIRCKNTWHAEQQQTMRNVMAEIDAHLHQNRKILEILMGNATKIELDVHILTQTGFRYEYHTGTHLNNAGNFYRIVYDYKWMDVSDQKILILRIMG